MILSCPHKPQCGHLIHCKRCICGAGITLLPQIPGMLLNPARLPLKRLIQREIADKAAVLILDGAVTEDGAVRVDVVDGTMTVTAA